MKMKYIIYLLLIIGIGGLVAYRIIDNQQSKQVSKSSAQNQNIPTIDGMVLLPSGFEEDISLSGTLEANEQIAIRSEVSGLVERINFTEGSKVNKGQLLVKINDVELRARLSKATTAQNLAQENERRAALLLEKQAISQEEYDMASAEYFSAKAEIQLIQAQLQKTSIYAPFQGTIGLRNISVGEYLTSNDIIANLVNTDRLKLTFSIPEKYASRVKIDDVFNFTSSNTQKTHQAKIYAIEPTLDLQTRTLKMRGYTNNENQTLYPGMFVSIALPLETITDALMVPSESLIPIQNGKKIFVFSDGKAVEREVQTGARTSSMVRVLSGLKPGDTILTYGVMALENGTPVKLRLKNPS
ncbi:RND family efflux transporter MFP subunit [Galbibacter marinus]|uniref:RND family efflux transporter MFP subunit n=1 Tax=Galbibacter marinus TaxID=555500 RepID=K2PSZ3_9FLAO|nr:RND family efflux transporter MFP subunit [Galbibacter marinus]